MTFALASVRPRPLASIAFAALLLGLVGPSRSEEALPAPVAQALRAAQVPTSAVGAYVHEIGKPRATIAHNAGVAMNPASVMKLVTTFVGLDALGPAFTWTTQILADQPIRDGVLDGPLYVKGGGDPKLTIESFWLMLRTLRARGLREIRGGLVLDRSYFDAPAVDPARFDQQPSKPYNVGPDALMLNFKSVRFRFLPDADRGTVTIAPEPRLPQLDLQNQVQLGAGECPNWRAALKADVQSEAASARVVFSGTMPASCGEQSWYFSLLSHPEFFFGAFKDLWQELGGTLSGRWRDGAVPSTARPLASIDSPALAELARDINKFSNNVMAQHLLLTLSAELTRLPGTPERSARVVASWLKQRSVDLPELVIENGSGLSRDERISALGVGRLLLSAYASPVMPEFIASMPLVGIDGTMRRRLRADGVTGQAHVKTGGLNDVRTIAGYVLDRTGKRHALAFFINHPRAHLARGAEEVLLRWVYESGQRGGS